MSKVQSQPLVFAASGEWVTIHPSAVEPKSVPMDFGESKRKARNLHPIKFVETIPFTGSDGVAREYRPLQFGALVNQETVWPAINEAKQSLRHVIFKPESVMLKAVIGKERADTDAERKQFVTKLYAATALGEINISYRNYAPEIYVECYDVKKIPSPTEPFNHIVSICVFDFGHDCYLAHIVSQETLQIRSQIAARIEYKLSFGDVDMMAAPRDKLAPFYRSFAQDKGSLLNGEGFDLKWKDTFVFVPLRIQHPSQSFLMRPDLPLPKAWRDLSSTLRVLRSVLLARSMRLTSYDANLAKIKMAPTDDQSIRVWKSYPEPLDASVLNPPLNVVYTSGVSPIQFSKGTAESISKWIYCVPKTASLTSAPASVAIAAASAPVPTPTPTPSKEKEKEPEKKLTQLNGTASDKEEKKKKTASASSTTPPILDVKSAELKVNDLLDFVDEYLNGNVPNVPHFLDKIIAKFVLLFSEPGMTVHELFVASGTDGLSSLKSLFVGDKSLPMLEVRMKKSKSIPADEIIREAKDRYVCVNNRCVMRMSDSGAQTCNCPPDMMPVDTTSATPQQPGKNGVHFSSDDDKKLVASRHLYSPITVDDDTALTPPTQAQDSPLANVPHLSLSAAPTPTSVVIGSTVAPVLSTPVTVTSVVAPPHAIEKTNELLAAIESTIRAQTTVAPTPTTTGTHTVPPSTSISSSSSTSHVVPPPPSQRQQQQPQLQSRPPLKRTSSEVAAAVVIPTGDGTQPSQKDNGDDDDDTVVIERPSKRRKIDDEDGLANAMLELANAYDTVAQLHHRVLHFGDLARSTHVFSANTARGNARSYRKAGFDMLEEGLDTGERYQSPKRD